jgi:hypothetical protein
VTTDATKSLSVVGDENDIRQLAGCAKNLVFLESSL